MAKDDTIFEETKLNLVKILLPAINMFDHYGMAVVLVMK